MSDAAGGEGSPFRPLPFPLKQLRELLRWIRCRGVRRRMRGRFRHGRHVAFASDPDVRAPNFVEFGHHISVGKKFTCEVNLRVGNYVLISSNVSIVGKDHPFDDPNLTVYTQQRTDDSLVEIGSDVLLGFGSIVIGSCKIGDGCIVGAGSVISRDLPPYTICAGVPARPIRPRYPDHLRGDADDQSLS
jgi:acetyltransferase-like isoleucine patch superfamily enzyme